MQFPMAKMLDVIAPPVDIHPASFPPPPVVPAVYFKFWPHIVVPSPIVMGTAQKTFVNGMPAAPMSSKTISFHWPGI